ncbi:MAG TPA: hypothetical protein VF334_15880 [Polyangia bacterium]
MRYLIAVLLLCTACSTNAEDDVQILMPDLSMPSDCPTGMQSPTYCFAGAQGTGSSCGPCTNVGEMCDYFEATLVCAGDHQWRCYWAGGSSGGCPHGDGGL